MGQGEDIAGVMAWRMECSVCSSSGASRSSIKVARAVVTLASSLVGVYREMDRSLDEVRELYQGFAVAMARG